MATKSQIRTFPLSVVFMIATGKNLFPRNPIPVVLVAEVNEFLFPKSGGCMGLLVHAIALKKSKPEILRQHPLLKKFEKRAIERIENVFAELGSDRIELVSTGE